MRSVVIGLGETGRPLFNVLKGTYPETFGYDMATSKELPQEHLIDFLNICIPYSPEFLANVQRYQKSYPSAITIIHSTVPIGTTDNLKRSVHSPILGKHGNMERSLRSFVKWVGGELADDVSDYLKGAGFTCKVVESARETEALKLICLAKYGKDIAFAGYVNEICSRYNIPYNHVIEWDVNYNSFVAPHLRRPYISPPDQFIGGHCVIANTEILNAQHPNPMLQEVLKYQRKESTYKAWGVCNIYESARIGDNVNIGTFTEIGNNVTIGNNVRIGAMCYIPEGVTIEEDVFIGPRVTFTNDKYPPSHKENWLPTVVKKGARLGAGVTVICGVTIGQGALIGAGSVVTKDVPNGEKWCGIPAGRMDK